MQSFGERLRHERETRNTTIEEISAATGIHRGFLEALEKNEFGSLPGGAFGKFYLRAYAEILDFDPEPLMVHYDRERHRDPPEAPERRPDEPTLRRVEASLAQWRASHGGRKVVRDVEVAVEQPVEIPEPTMPEVVPEVVELVHAQDVPATEELKPNAISGLRELLAATVGVAVVGLAIAIYLGSRPSPPVAGPPVSQPVASAPQAAVPIPAPVQAPAPALPTPSRPKRAEPPAASATSTPSTTTVSEFGVGLSNQADRVEAPIQPFHEGDVVAFSTRVQGGAGQSIRHVWLHNGRAVQSIRLRVGATDWRTHSTKTLWGAGSWSVEARDESGRILAQSAFACERKTR
jgi:cytoskeletal protein RodZ